MDTTYFKVKETASRDTGRGIVRIDPVDMKKLGISVGDIALICSEKAEVPSKVMPCYLEERGKEIIQMDGLLRENLGTALDKKVSIKKTTVKTASKITLLPLNTKGVLQGDNNKKYLGSLLEGIPVAEGNRIRAKLFGSGQLDFKVLETHPKGAVIIDRETQLKVKTNEKATKKTSRISYEDIGGLSSQIHKIREMIELPLNYPQIFQHLGIDAPKGVLLSGPPGTGKTLIARAVANETNCYFYSISGPEIMGKLYGESEEKVRKIFETAKKNAPAIVFIDEIDSIAPKRDSIGDEKQVERRVVAQLLALLDGLEGRGQVIVIAATNLPDALDPALRRPGRFDREIRIPIPDRVGREEILQIHTSGMPLADDVNVIQLAEKTHGFVGTDLEALSREAAMCTLRKIMPEIDFEAGELPYEQLIDLKVSMEDFLEAMKDVEPSAIREFFVEVPTVKWEQVGGLPQVKQELQEAVEWPLKYGDLFAKANTKAPKGILLYGVPGTGKTLLAKAAASESGVNFISVKGPSLISKYVGESEKAVREVFKTAKQAAPTILFFDEIDAVVPKRGGSSSDSATTERVIAQFLAEMDGVEELNNVVVLGATNRKDIIDPAILRSGRFDLLLEVPPPDQATRLEIFKIHTEDKQLADNISLEELANKTPDMVGADIEFICKKAAMLSIRAFIASSKTKDEEFVISKSHFIEAITMVIDQKEKSVPFTVS